MYYLIKTNKIVNPHIFTVKSFVSIFSFINSFYLWHLFIRNKKKASSSKMGYSRVLHFLGNPFPPGFAAFFTDFSPSGRFLPCSHVQTTFFLAVYQSLAYILAMLLRLSLKSSNANWIDLSRWKSIVRETRN